MSLAWAVVIALKPEGVSMREQRRAERVILRLAARDEHMRVAYGLATSDRSDIGGTAGAPHWGFLRAALARSLAQKC